MAYTKTSWVDAVTPISAANMNKIETGIDEAHDAIENPTFDSEATVTQPITSLASTVLEAPFSTAYLRGRTTNGYDANTKLLMYFEGLDASTSFTDQTGKTVVASGNAQIDTAQKRWGTSSGLFDGTGDYLTVTDANSDLDLGSGDFTIECWVRLNTLSLDQVFVDFRIGFDNIGPTLYIDSADNKFKLLVSAAPRITGTTVAVTGVWYHLAIVKSNNVTKLFVNGVQEGSNYTDNNNYQTVTTIRVGADYTGEEEFNGWMDELRISNTARYTATFIPQGLNLLSTDKMRVLSVGKNLINKSALTYGAAIWPGTGVITTAGGYAFTEFIRVLPSTQYTKSTTGEYIHYYDENRVYLGYATTSTFTTPVNCVYVVANTIIATQLAGLQLEKGAVATTYETYKSTSAIVPVVLNSVSDTIYDKFDMLTGQHTKNVSDVVTLSGNAFTYTFQGDGIGWKYFATSLGAFPLMKVGEVYSIKSNNKRLTYTTNIVSSDCLTPIGAQLYVSVSDADSGWDESWVSGTSFTGLTWGGLIKAYMNGWKLTTANDNVASCVWTGIASGTVKNAGAADYAHCYANIDVGFQPYQMYYQLATPIVTNYYPNILNSEPSGTILVEPVISDWDLYDTNVNISDVAKPMSSLAYVNLINTTTGALTPVDLNTCTVSVGGLTFTISGASAGQYYDFAYNYIGLSSQPSLTYGTVNNLKATVDGLSKSVTCLDEKIEGNITQQRAIIVGVINDMGHTQRSSFQIATSGWKF